MTTLLYTHESSLGHHTPPGHPERPDRIRAIEEVLRNGDFSALKRETAERVDPAAVKRVHPAAYFDAIHDAVPPEGKLSRIDADTALSHGSWEPILRAAGGATHAVDQVMGGRADNAFVAMRPPGHHAETATAMGIPAQRVYVLTFGIGFALAAFGGAVNWFVGCHGGRDATEHPIGIVTSIDQANLKSGIWKEIAVWRSRSEYMTRAFDMTSTRLFAKHAPDTWYVEARTWAKRADPEAQGRAMSGIHGKYIMAVLDEAGDIPVPLLRVAKQILSSEHQWAKLLIGGNPTSLEGVLYQACVIESHLTYSISITADPERPDRGKRTDIENAREAIKLYGRENPWVKATILGEFPPASINALLGIEDVENAMRRHYRIDAYEWAEKRLGVDCARFGDDRSMLCPRQGVVWFNPEALRNVRTSVIAGRIVQAVQKWEPHDPTSIRILIDQTGGWGQGTVDQLIVAGYPAMELVYSTPSPDPRFFNLRSYMHFKLAEHVRERAHAK